MREEGRRWGVVPTHALETAPADIALSVYFFEQVRSPLDVPLDDGVVDEFIVGVLVKRELRCPGAGQCGGYVDVFVIARVDDGSFPFVGRHGRCSGDRSSRRWSGPGGFWVDRNEPDPSRCGRLRLCLPPYKTPVSFDFHPHSPFPRHDHHDVLPPRLRMLSLFSRLCPPRRRASYA